MDLRDTRELLEDQSGVVARRQLVERGATEPDLRRWLRRRDLVAVHPGVYVNHTGPLTWINRAWAAVLLLEPAALCHESAVHLAGPVVHVAVAHDRSPTRGLGAGIRLHWLTDLDQRVMWGAAPPRVRFEDAVLTLCAEAPTRTAALTVAADACRRRRTTPERLLAELDARGNLRRRAWMRGVLTEAQEGVQSALESSYLRRVERAHGLPRGVRQVRERPGTGVVYRDVLYVSAAVAVELDGRVGHELSRERWNDMDRDLDAAAGGLLTLRVGWRQCEDEPCATAARIAAVLRRRGWRGSPRACGPGCDVSGMQSVTATR